MDHNHTSELDGNKDEINRFIFDQNLDEVFLLIDFVSSHAGHTLNTLTIPNFEGSDMTSAQIIKRVAEMRFPPNRSDNINAEDAAILLLAKNSLNRLAAPSTGLTIAYTAMFIDAEVNTWPRRLWCSLTRGLRDFVYFSSRKLGGSEPPNQRKSGPTDERINFASHAFPVLKAHADRFRLWRDCLAGVAIFWLLITALAYWDAGLGRAAIERLDQNWKAFTDELRDNPTLLACDEKPSASFKVDFSSGQIQSVALEELSCRRYAYQRWKGEAARKEVQSVFRCEQMSRHSVYLHVWCWQELLARYDPEKPISKYQEKADHSPEVVQIQMQEAQDIYPRPRQPSSEIKDNATYWQTATSRLSVFTTYVLPMMFALLGTLIGAFRAINNRVRERTLAPRDFGRMLLGIPTGLVAGVAVGLFLSPSSVPIQGAGGVAGQLSLTAIGLGFLAGYASHSFFNYLDNLVTTALPAAPTTTVAVAPKQLS